MDSDGDGVADYLDKCPETPKGATINSAGCWAYEGVVLFGLDKYEIRPEAEPLLDEVVTVMKQNSGIKVEI